MFVPACSLMRYKGDDDFKYAETCNISNIPNYGQKNYIHPDRQKFYTHPDPTEKFKNFVKYVYSLTKKGVRGKVCKK